jgi:adenosylhomocysteine nucleosidase
MKVLVTFAVAAEFAPWLRLRKDWIVKDAALHAYEFSANDLQVCVILTGIGCRRTWDANAIACWGSDFDVCISSGLAGALRPEHKVGAVLVARGLCEPRKHDLLPCDPDLVQSAAELGAKPVEAFCTADRILVKAAEKRELSKLADAVEMESRRVVGIAGFGSGWSARCVAIRAISDEAGEDLPLDFNRTLTLSGDIHVPAIVKEVIRKPWIIPRVIRFAGRSRRAARELALFLDKFVLALPSVKKLEIFEEVAAT